MEIEINKQLNKSSSSNQKAGARYECIYKNLLRELRQYYNSNFEEFIKRKFMKQTKYFKNKYLLFPYLILEMSKSLFDENMIK